MFIPVFGRFFVHILLDKDLVRVYYHSKLLSANYGTSPGAAFESGY